MGRDEPRTDDRRSAANRRRFLKGLGALGVVGLAGCGGDGGDGDTPTATDEPDTDTEGGNGNGMGDTDTPTDAETATPTDTAIEDVEVTDNQLTIGAVSSQENPKFSGIEIQEA